MTMQLRVFSGRDLANAKAKAMRRGPWYRALTKIERACMDLVIRLVDEVRSKLLAKILLSVMKKLEEAMD